MGKKKIDFYVKFDTSFLIYWELVPVGTEMEPYQCKYRVEHEISDFYTMEDAISDCKRVLLAFSTHMIRNKEYAEESDNLYRMFTSNIAKALNSNWNNKILIADSLGSNCSIFIYYGIEENEFKPYTLYLKDKQIRDLHIIASDNQKDISESFNETMRNTIDVLISTYKEAHKKDGEDM